MSLISTSPRLVQAASSAFWHCHFGRYPRRELPAASAMPSKTVSTIPPPPFTVTEAVNASSQYRTVRRLERRVALCHRILSAPELSFRRRVLLEHIEGQFSGILRVVHNQLDDLKVICPTTKTAIRALFRLFGETNAEFRVNLSLSPKPAWKCNDEQLAEILQQLTEGARRARAGELRRRLEYECLLAHRAGWYIIFNTLTVNDENLDAVFETGSRCFSDYIRSVSRSVGYRLGMSKRQADASEGRNHRYFAVVERGAEHGRPHIHVLHFLRALPQGSYDPNGVGVRKGPAPLLRQLDSMRPFWRYGNTVPIMVRYGMNDAFSRAGYRWPIKILPNGAQTPLPCGTILRVAGYVGKYVTKRYANPENEKWTKKNLMPLWRVRMTRGFGTEWMTARLSKLPTAKLEQLIRVPRRVTVTGLPMGRKLPTWRMVRPLILRILNKRRRLSRYFTALTPAPSIAGPRGMKLLLERLAPPPENFGVSSRTARRLRAAIFNLLEGLDIADFLWYNVGGSVV